MQSANFNGSCKNDNFQLKYFVLRFLFLLRTYTPQPLYNTVHYNTVLDIARINVGPQMVI